MQETNKMSECNLGIVWGPTLMDSQSAPDPTEMGYQSKIVELVICNYSQVI